MAVSANAAKHRFIESLRLLFFEFDGIEFTLKPPLKAKHDAV